MKHKTINTLDFGLQIKNISESGTFEGYISVFDNIDHGDDVVEKGAFNKRLKKDKVYPLLYQHQASEIVGGFKASEDNYGLRMEDAFFNMDVQKAREAWSNAKKGLLTGLSIGYSVHEYEYDSKKGIRYLKDLELYEGSIVTFPMNDKARISAVKKFTERELERYLREAGLSRAQSKAVLHGGYKAMINLRDAEKNNANGFNQAINDLIKTIRG